MQHRWPRLSALALFVFPVFAGAQGAADQGSGTIQATQRLTATDGWVFTDSAALATVDGGATWSDVTPSRSLDGLTDVFFLDAAHAWLAGTEPGTPNRLVVLRTSDRGRSWQEQAVESSALDADVVYTRAHVHFIDPLHGWLVGRVASSAALSVGELFRTTDGGSTWERLPRPPVAERVVFADARHGFMVGASPAEALQATTDGGRSWHELKLPLGLGVDSPLFTLPAFSTPREGRLTVTVGGRHPRLLTFATHDGGRTWQADTTLALPGADVDEPVKTAVVDGRVVALASGSKVTLDPSGTARTFELPGLIATPDVRALSFVDSNHGWALVAEGVCEPNECRQLTRLVALDAAREDDRAASTLLTRTHSREVETGGSTRGSVISTNYGFDKCVAPTTAQMQTWWNNSSYRDVNIYYGGSVRACPSQPDFATWLPTVFAQGWRAIPTWVGRQSECWAYANPPYNTFPSDAAGARAQGLAEADAAVSAASAIGLGTGTPLYYNLENYNETNTACSTGARAFINAWVERVKSYGYIAGVYGNAYDAQHDWIPGIIANPPDALWAASWYCNAGTTSCNWTPTVFGIPGLSDSYWTNNQRIRQYWGDHNETFGGVTLNIDSDYANGPVAVAGGGGCIATVPSGRWKGEYFPNRTLSGSPTLVRDDGAGTINFNWGGGGPNTCGIGADNFSVRWTRTFSFAAGTWRFTTTTDDGVRLYVDGVLKIDRWIDQGPTTYTADVVLGAGNHTIRMDYYENGGGAVAQLSWQNVSQTTSFLCDDGDSCFTRYGPTGYWHRETLCGGSSVGYGGDLYWTYVNGSTVSNYARWRPSITGAGNFEVYVWVPRCFATSQQARYRIYHNGVSEYRTVNQNAYYDTWVSLGTFYFAANGTELVELTDATGESPTSYRYLGFDAVYWVRR